MQKDSSRTVFVGTWRFSALPLQEVARLHRRKQQQRLLLSETTRDDDDKTVDSDDLQALVAMVVDAIEAVELNPNQGTVGAPGSAPNRDGAFELDAAIMSAAATQQQQRQPQGSSTDIAENDPCQQRSCGSCGAVLGLRSFNGAVRAAAHVAAASPHSILSGQGATMFAEERARAKCGDAKLSALRIKSSSTSFSSSHVNENHVSNKDEQQVARGDNRDQHTDTVGIIGFQRSCSASSSTVRIVAATSTSGIAGKHPGRIGDSALFGSGLYCDPDSGACVATGDGDVIALFPISFVCCQLMAQHCENKTMTVSHICQLALKQFFASPHVQNFVRRSRHEGADGGKRMTADGGPMIAICAIRASDGQVGAACNSEWKKEFVYSSVVYCDDDADDKLPQAVVTDMI